MLDFGSRDYAQSGSRDYSQHTQTRDSTLTRFGSFQPVQEEQAVETEQTRDQALAQSRDQTRATFMSRDYSIPTLDALNPGKDSLFAGAAREIESREDVQSREVESRDPVVSRDTASRDPVVSRRPNLRSVVVKPAKPAAPAVTLTEDTPPPVTSAREKREAVSGTSRPSRLASGLESWQAEVSLTQAEGVSWMEREKERESRVEEVHEEEHESRDSHSDAHDSSRDNQSYTESRAGVTVSVPLNDEPDESRARRGTPLPSRDRSARDKSHDISISRDRGSPGGAPDSALEESFEEHEEEESESRDQGTSRDTANVSRDADSHEKSFSNINYFTNSREKNKSLEEEEEDSESDIGSRDFEIAEDEPELEVESRDYVSRELNRSRESVHSNQSSHSAQSHDSADSSRFKSRYLRDLLPSRDVPESRDMPEDHRMADTSLDRIKQSAIKKHTKARDQEKSREEGASHDQNGTGNTSVSRDLLSSHRMEDTSWDNIKQSAIKRHTKSRDGVSESQIRENDSIAESRDTVPRDLLNEHRMEDTSWDRIKASAIKKHTKPKEARDQEKSRDMGNGDRSRDTQPRDLPPPDLTMPNTSMAEIIAAAKKRHSKSREEIAREQEVQEQQMRESRERVEREIREKDARDKEKLAQVEAARAERLAKRRRTEEGHVSVGQVSEEPPHVTSRLRHVTLEPPKSVIPAYIQAAAEEDDVSVISELSEVDIEMLNGESNEEEPRDIPEESRDFTSRYGIPEFDETVSREETVQEIDKSREPVRESRDRSTIERSREQENGSRVHDSRASFVTAPSPGTPTSPDSKATDFGSPRDHGDLTRDIGKTHVVESRDKSHNRQNSILSPFEKRTVAIPPLAVGKRRFSESRDPSHPEARDIATVNEWRSLDFLITSSLQQQVWANKHRAPGNAVLRIPPSIRTCFPLVSESRLRDMIVSIVYLRQNRLKERKIVDHRERRREGDGWLSRVFNW